MDYVQVLRPTLWCNSLFGFSSLVLSSDSVRQSSFLQIYRYLFYIGNVLLQTVWICQNIYFKYTSRDVQNLQELILLSCVISNILVSYLPIDSVLSNGGQLYYLISVMNRYEKEIFSSSPRRLRHLLRLNIAVLACGFMVPVVFMALEAARTWTSYSIGKHSVLMDITGLSSGFLRPCMDVVYLDSYLMYMLLYGTSYASINSSLLRYARCSALTRRRLGSNFFLKYLKHLEDLDNALQDFHMEVMQYYSAFCIVIVILAFLNWFYVVGFVFLNMSPRFMTYPAWVVFFSIIFFSIIGSSVFARQQINRTAGLLHRLDTENDDPRIAEEVEILSLQLIHRQAEFDACGFFNLDFSLLLSMVGTVTTYVLILIQFEDTPSGRRSKCFFNSTELCPNND